MATRTLIRFAISALVFVVFLAHIKGWVAFRLFDQIENLSYDARVVATMPGTVDPRVVIVDVDEKSIAAEGHFPWPRDTMAVLVRQLFDVYKVRVVGFDMNFPEADRNAGLDILDRLGRGPLADVPGFEVRAAELRPQLNYDRVFAAEIARHPVVLGYSFKTHLGKDEPEHAGALPPPLMAPDLASQFALDYPRAAGYVGNLDVLQQATPLAGFFDNPLVDPDGVFRRVPLTQMYKGAVYPSLAFALARAALGNPEVQFEFDPPDARAALNLERVRLGDRYAPVDGAVAAYVPYRGPQGSFPYVSATDVLHGRADAAILSDRIVLIGTTSAGLYDMRVTPVARVYAGVEVHANLISGLLDNRIKQKAPYYAGIEVVLLLLVGVLVAGLFPRLSPLAGAGMALALLALQSGLAFGMWQSADFIMPLGTPVLYTVAVFTVQQLYGYLIEQRRARDTAKKFGQYVPKEIVEEIAASGKEISMEGQAREMSVLFSDVRGFTGISEKLEPKALSELMNQFLTPLTGVVQKHRGTIDKYMGDAIMAFWGAPLDDPGHARHALQAALEMVQAVRALEQPFSARGWPPIRIGVGVNTGIMRVGNMGSEFRVAYTVMGDPVNLGSRLEGLTKEYGAPAICSEYTKAQAPDWTFRELDRVRVKGKGEPVAIFEPLGPKETVAEDLRQELSRHRIALRAYRNQAWDEAEREFFGLSRLPDAHPVYALYLERIAHFRSHPPGEGWDGAFTFKTK